MVTKERLFEVMGRLDKTFKPKLNESLNLTQYFSNMWSKNDYVIAAIKNNHNLMDKYGKYLVYSPEQWDMVTDEELRNLWKSWTMDSNNLNEESPFNDAINTKYTHFAVLNDTGKIVNGWDYSDVDKEELRTFKNDYFAEDLLDLGISLRNVKILTLDTLRKRGIDPFKIENWNVKGV
jgi:hypothetical protein